MRKIWNSIKKSLASYAIFKKKKEIVECFPDFVWVSFGYFVQLFIWDHRNLEAFLAYRVDGVSRYRH